MLQCSVYPRNSTASRCQNLATLWLIQPDGKRNPGGFICEKHAHKILAEYEKKSADFPELAGWTAQPIDEYGNPVRQDQKYYNPAIHEW